MLTQDQVEGAARNATRRARAVSVALATPVNVPGRLEMTLQTSLAIARHARAAETLFFDPWERI